MSFIVVHGYSPDIQVRKFETMDELRDFVLYDDTCSHSRDMVIAKEISLSFTETQNFSKEDFEALLKEGPKPIPLAPDFEYQCSTQHACPVPTFKQADLEVMTGWKCHCGQQWRVYRKGPNAQFELVRA